RLWRLLRPRLLPEHMLTVYETLERPMPRVLADMELAGIRIDPGYLSQLSGEFGMRMAELEAKAHQLAGRPFNLGSPKQIGDLLYGELGLEGGKKTAKGAAYSDVKVLEDLAAQGHELPRVILDWRQPAKLKGNYTDNLVAAARPETQ